MPGDKRCRLSYCCFDIKEVIAVEKKILFPLPLIHPTFTKVFWDACKRHELLIQKCRDCGTYRYPPREACNKCLSLNTDWVKVSGRGTVYSYCVPVEPSHPDLVGKPPYSIALVDLEEGPRMITNIVECDPYQVKIGMPVEVVFEDLTDQISLAKFRPAKSSPSRPARKGGN